MTADDWISDPSIDRRLTREPKGFFGGRNRT